MRDHEFDSILKKRLEQYGSEVPADMWERIARKKKRRFGFLWWQYFLLMIPVAVLTTLYIYHSRENRTDVNKNTVFVSTPGHPHNNSTSGQTTAEDISTMQKDNFTGHFNSAGARKDISAPKKDAPVEQQNKNVKANPSQDKSNQQETFVGDNDSAVEHTTTMQPEQKKETKPAKASDTTTITDETRPADKFSLRFFASPDIVFSNVNSTDQNYEHLLKNSIRMKLSYTIGAAVHVPVSKKIAFSTGIQYSRVNEEISFEDSALSTSSSIKNHLSFINIPFTVGYKTNWTSVFQTTLNAGMLVNIFSHYKGSMPAEFGGAVDISHNVYKGNTGLSLYAGINLSQDVGERTSIFAEPYFRYQITNMANDLQSFNRKLHTAGLSAGIQIRLFDDQKE